jgi:cytoskeletal protein CcmA (bactofilin family)
MASEHKRSQSQAKDASGVAVALGQAMPQLEGLPVLTESAQEPIAAADSPAESAEPPLPVVAVTSGPPAAPAVLAPRPIGLEQAPNAAPSGVRHSTISAGLAFTGSALIDGSITVAGEVRGDLMLGELSAGLVTVTETGHVVGDIRARNISVLGRTVGTLDAPGGKVSLHDTAIVSGRIRYAHLQVNGADLNAQLERVRDEDQGENKR